MLCTRSSPSIHNLARASRPRNVAQTPYAKCGTAIYIGWAGTIRISCRTGGRDIRRVSGLPSTCRERVQSLHAELLEVTSVSRDYSQVMDEGSRRNHAVLQ